MPRRDNRSLPDDLLESPSRSRRGAVRRQRRRSGAALGILALIAVAVVVAGVVLGSGYLRGADGKRLSAAQNVPPAPAIVPASATAVAVEAATETPAPSAAPTPSPVATRVVEIGWVGDLTPGSKYGNPPDNGRALFKYAREFLTEPDVMVANLEGTFGKGGPSKCDGRKSTQCFAFQAPPANAEALSWAGIDVVNQANNHSNDYLAQGLRSTRKALAANGIDNTGLVDAVALKEVDGVRIAFLGFSPYPWGPDIGKIKSAKKLVRAAHEDADIVVVIMHAGAEGADKTRTPTGAEHAYGEFRGDPRAFSHAVIDAGADLVVGSGPHVVRGMERYKDRLIAYSLGNFAGWRNFSRSGRLALSGILTVRLAEDGRVLDGRWRSMRIDAPGVPKPDPTREAVKLVRKLSEQDFASPVELEKDGSFEFATP